MNIAWDEEAKSGTQDAPIAQNIKWDEPKKEEYPKNITWENAKPNNAEGISIPKIVTAGPGGLLSDKNKETFQFPNLEEIIQSPLAKGIKEVAVAGPVSPGVVDIQGTPGRAVLTPYERLAREGSFQVAGVTAIPFVGKTVFDDLDKDLGKSILGYTSPGTSIVKDITKIAENFPAFASTQSGPIGTLSTAFESMGVLKPQTIGKSTGVDFIGTQLDLMTSPNLLKFIEYPLQVRYGLANQIFQEIGKYYKAKGGNIVIDEAEYLRWAESKDPSFLRSKLAEVKERIRQLKTPKVSQETGIEKSEAKPFSGKEEKPSEEATPVVNKRKLQKFDIEKAISLGDSATLIKAYGGVDSKSDYFKNFAPEERKKLFPFMRKGAGSPDKLLQELKGSYPDLFPYDTGYDLLRAMIDGTIYKKVDINALEKELEAASAEQARQAELEKISVEDADAIIQKEIDAERSAIESEGSAEGVDDSFDFGVKESTQSYGEPFYSAVARAARVNVPDNATPAQVLNTIKNTQGVKQEEIDWLGLEDFLSGKQKVSKKELLDFIDQNKVQIREITKGKADELQFLETKSNNGLPTWVSNIGRREVAIVKLPQGKAHNYLAYVGAKREYFDSFKFAKDWVQSEYEATSPGTKFQSYQLPGGKNYREVLLTLPPSTRRSIFEKTGKLEAYGEAQKHDFHSPHWDEPNVIAHFRLNDRTIDGKKTLFLDESRGVPDAPFKKTWHELALKRILRMAVEEGYDAISWTTGEQQAERYDLSKQVDKIGWMLSGRGGKRVEIYPKSHSPIIIDVTDDGVVQTIKGSGEFEGKRLEDVVGKDVAEKIKKDNVGLLKGEGLKVGGEGMRGFYDLIIPAFLNKYTKKWGGKAGIGSIEKPVGETEPDIYGDPELVKQTGTEKEKVHILEITPAMRESVIQGQALFEPKQVYFPGFEKDSKLPSESEVAYDSKEKESIEKVIQELQDKYSPANIRRAGIVRDLREVKHVNFSGRVIDGPDTLAQIHQVFRSPAIESFCFYVTKSDGTIISNQIFSSGLVDQVFITDEIYDSVLKELTNAGKGAKLYIAHNHPSGRTAHSREDSEITRKFASIFPESFSGHLVIDHGEYLFMDRNLDETRGNFNIQNAELKWNENVVRITGPENLSYLFGDVLRGKKNLHVSFLDKGNNLVALELLNPVALGNKLIKSIVDAKRRYAATSYIILGDSETIQKMNESKIPAYPIGLLDVIEVDPNGYKSWNEQGNTPKTVDRGNVVFEPNEKYAKEQDASEYHNENDSPEKNYARRNWDLSEKSKEIIRKYAERIGERYVPRGNLGYFYGKSKNIFVKALNDISTVCHEVTHYLDKKYKLWSTVKNSTTQGDRVRKELTRLYTNLYGNGKPNHPLRKRIQEGIATLIENYAMKPEEINNEYPLLVSLFIDKNGKYYVPEIGELINDVREIVKEYGGLGSFGRMSSRMSNTKHKMAAKTFFNTYDSIKSFLKDGLWRMEKMENMNGTVGTDAPSNWCRILQNVGSMVYRNIHAGNGFWSWRNGTYEKVLPFNWGDLVAQIQKAGASDTFGNWLIARRQFFMWKRLEELPDKIAELSNALNEMIPEADPEAFKQAQAQLISFQNQMSKVQEVLANDKYDRKDVTEVYEMFKDEFEGEAKMFDSLVAADLEMLADPEVMLIKQAEKDAMIKSEGYATYHRDIYNEVIGEDVAGISAPRRSSQKPSFLKERYGSDLDILNPLYGQILNHAESLRKAMRQTVYNKLLILADAYPEMFQPTSLVAIPQEDGSIHYPQLSDPNIFMARKEYKRVPVLTDKSIKTLIDTTLNAHNFDAFARIVLGFKRIFTVGTTSAFPPFAIVNFARDQMTAQMLSVNAKFKPFYSSTQALRAALSDTEDSKYVEEYFALGGERQTLAGLFDKDPQEVLSIISDEVLNQGKIAKMIEQGASLRGAIGVLSTPVEKAVHVMSLPAQYSEYATRLAEYIESRKAGKDQLSALEDAGRITGSFHHFGDWGNSALLVSMFKMIPFANANLQVTWQSTERLFAEKNPKLRARAHTTLAIVTALMAVGLGTVLKFGTEEDREQYKNIDARLLSKYIYFPNPFGRGLVRIPVPEQLGVFGALMNSVFSNIFLGTKYKPGEMFDLASSWIPDQFNIFDVQKFFVSWIPQPISPLISFITNTKTFPDVGPIDRYPRYAGNKKYRHSSDVAIEIGKLTNTSPAKIDFLIRGYLTRSIQYVPGFSPSNKTWLANSIDSFKGGILRDYYFNAGRNVREYYEIRDRNEKDWSAFKNKERDFRSDELQKIIWNRNILNVNKKNKKPGLNKLMQLYNKLDEKEISENSDRAQRLSRLISHKISLLKS